MTRPETLQHYRDLMVQARDLRQTMPDRVHGATEARTAQIRELATVETLALAHLKN